MARKRLSNLNSEGAKKAPELKLESANSPSASKEVEPPDAKAADAKAADAKAETVEVNVEKPPKANAQPKESSQTKTQTKVLSVEPLEIDVPYVEVKDEEAASSQQDSETAAIAESTIAESTESSKGVDADAYKALEATIAQLNATLDTVRQTAKRRENELLDQIAELQTALQTQQEAAKQLQAELKQSSQLKTELEEAKKMILQLSQVNAQPTPPISPATRTQVTEPELESSTSKPVSKPISPPPSVPSTPQRDDRTPAITLQRQSPYPARQNPFAVSPEKKATEKLPEQDSKLSDSDMGWVD